MNVTLDEAKKLIAAVQAKAESVNKPVTAAVVDSGGYLVAIERMDGARPLQPSIATAKAYTAAVMQRPGAMLKGWQDAQPTFFAQLSSMGLHPILAAEGAVTIKRDGTLIGGLGVAGGTGPEDQQVCEEALGDQGYDLDFVQFNSLK